MSSAARLMALGAGACCLLATAGLALVVMPGPAERTLVPSGRVRRRERWALLIAVAARMSARLAPLARPLISASRERLMRERVAASGRVVTFPGYLGTKATWALLGGTAGMALTLAGGDIVFVPAFAALGWLLPDFWVCALVSRRQRRIARDLPDFLDVLSVVVAAGTGFQEALDRVASQLGGPLADELRTTLAQIDLGTDRSAALEELRQRNKSDALDSFVAALLQADQLGIPLARTLKAISADMRRMFSQDARTLAARADPRITLVTAATLLPATLLLIVAALVASSGIAGQVLGG